MTAAGLLVLRVVVGVVLLAHGAHDLFGVFENPAIGHGGLSARSAHMASIGLLPAMLFAVVLAVVQLGGGLLLIVGAFARWVALAVAIADGLLLWKDASRWGFFLNLTGDPVRGQGMEFLLVIVAALICLFLTGPGSWSIDGFRHREAATRASARARLRTK
jgi:putative oxidoreductase